MKIGIYSESQHSANGGSEFCIGVLAAALSQSHDVEIVHHRTDMDRDKLAEHCGVDLSRVPVRYVPLDGYTPVAFRDPFQYYRNITRRNDTLSRPYEMFVTFSHAPPPPCHAAKGVMIVLFPNALTIAGGGPLEGLKTAFRHWAHRARFGGYQVNAAISEYTRHWTKEFWGIECALCHPPVDIAYDPAPKEDLVLSVGRFTDKWVSKHQREMVCAFRRLEQAEPAAGWRYACAGGLSQVPEDQDYFAEVSRLAEGHAVQILPNIRRDALKSLYERSSIFWHAAGYAQDVAARPGGVEHFGITTVEAMAAGCVPVVINKGGQPEIVEHGVSGFHWDTLDELETYTATLMQDRALRERMSEAARLRAQQYSRERFVARFCELAGVTV